MMQHDAHKHLALVQGDILGRPSAPVAELPFLSAQPFRPGEMPTPVPLRLSASCKRRLAHSAKAAGVPLGLWVRCAVEAARHVGEVALEIGVEASDLTTELEQVAASELDVAVITIDARRQIQYARALRRGDQAVAFEDSTSPVTAMVADTMLAGWTRAATARGCALDMWAEQQLGLSPQRPHVWEAAASEAGRSLGEWVYATTLARFRRR